MKENRINIVNKDKKRLLLLTVLGMAAVFLLILGSVGGGKTESSPAETGVPSASVSADAETELSALLSRIKGAGKVEVMVRYSGSGEDRYAYHEEVTEITEENASERREHKEMVLLNGDAPVVISHKNAEVEGVLVVAEGAANDHVRAALIEAVASYFHIGKNRIEVTAMEEAE